MKFSTVFVIAAAFVSAQATILPRQINTCPDTCQVEKPTCLKGVQVLSGGPGCWKCCIRLTIPVTTTTSEYSVQTD
ncbi:hypothetical protein BDQ17DRAFT_1344472 [Cyathus striatus]|nr:hypothetical protein BDQ17DRAFT_1344472 [Cyathus striatus]